MLASIKSKARETSGAGLLALLAVIYRAGQEMGYFPKDVVVFPLMVLAAVCLAAHLVVTSQPAVSVAEYVYEKWFRHNRLAALVVIALIGAVLGAAVATGGALLFEAHMRRMAALKLQSATPDPPVAATQTPGSPVTPKTDDSIDDALARLARLRSEVASLGQRPLVDSAGAKRQAATFDNQVNEALSSLPLELAAREAKQAEILKNELLAQITAEEIDIEFRPRLVDALELLRSIIASASTSGLVTLVREARGKLPDKIAYTIFALQESGIADIQAEPLISFVFADGVQWLGRLGVGKVSSPEGLARRLEGTDRSYPMIRLFRLEKEKEAPFSVIAFDLKTKAVYVAFGSEARSSVERRPRIEALEKMERGEDQVGAAILELLKASRLREF
jgi:hypothetical protein